MATRKTHGLTVKIGEYQKDGQTKNRYLNIGAVMKKDDGGRFILLNRHFNPAGVPGQDGRDTILVSMFAKDENQGPPAPEPSLDGFEDDIPF